MATGQTYMLLLSLMTAFTIQLVVIKYGNPVLCVCVPICVTFFKLKLDVRIYLAYLKYDKNMEQSLVKLIHF